MCKRKNKILLTIKTSSNIGGAERRLLRSFSSLKNDLIDYFIVGVDNDEDAKNILLDFVGNECRQKIIFDDSIVGYYNHIIKNKYKWIVYCNESLSFLPRAIISKISGAKILWIIAYTNTAYLKFNNLRHRILFYFYTKLANTIDCLYPSSKILLEKRLRKSITITPMPFTDLESFTPAHKENIIVFASRIERSKGWNIFLDALRNIRQEIVNKKYKVYICGSGSQSQDLNKKIKALNLMDIVIITGHIEMQSVLPQSKIFLSLQQVENYPSQSLLEAISCGCACIVTNVGDSKLIAKPEFSTLINPSVFDLGQAIESYMKLSDFEFREISRNARQFAEENFRIKDSADYYQRLLK